MRTDTELLRAWADGDRDAGKQLFASHFDAIYRFFLNKLDGDVDDLVQRTFAKCLESATTFRGDCSFRTFLYTIARHQLYDFWRARRRNEGLSFGVTSLHDLGPSPASIVAEHREQRLLLMALRHIPLELQLAVELHYWEGLTGPELAIVLEIPEGTVRSRLRRAREQLEAQMARLADSPELLQSTVDDFERWATSLRPVSGG